MIPINLNKHFLFLVPFLYLNIKALLYLLHTLHPSKHGASTNAVSMLAHRLRRWSNIETALGGFPVFAWMYV